MTGGVTRRDQCFAERETIAVFHLLMFELVLRTALVTHVNLRGVDPRAKFARTAHQIGVNVRFENMRDRHLRLTRHVDVNVAIRSRIEDRGDAFFVVAQKIRKLSDAFGLDRFEDERHR